MRIRLVCHENTFGVGKIGSRNAVPVPRQKRPGRCFSEFVNKKTSKTSFRPVNTSRNNMAEEIETDLTETESGETENKNAGENLSERRLPRSIRFSDAEWKLIEGVARERGMAAAELVRHVSVGFATGKFSTTPRSDFPTFLPEMSAQIERIYNGVYLLATLKRDQMLREGRQEELDKIIEHTRKSKDFFQGNASN